MFLQVVRCVCTVRVRVFGFAVAFLNDVQLSCLQLRLYVYCGISFWRCVGQMCFVQFVFSFIWGFNLCGLDIDLCVRRCGPNRICKFLGFDFCHRVVVLESFDTFVCDVAGFSVACFMLRLVFAIRWLKSIVRVSSCVPQPFFLASR